jgi:hypothetical protein
MGKYPYFPKVNSTWNKKQKFDSISIKEDTTPSNPDSDYEKLYFKSDGELYKLNSSGVESVVGGSSGGVVSPVMPQDTTPSNYTYANSGTSSDTPTNYTENYTNVATWGGTTGGGSNGSAASWTSYTTRGYFDPTKPPLITNMAFEINASGSAGYYYGKVQIQIKDIAGNIIASGGGSHTRVDFGWRAQSVSYSGSTLAHEWGTISQCNGSSTQIRNTTYTGSAVIPRTPALMNSDDGNYYETVSTVNPEFVLDFGSATRMTAIIIKPVPEDTETEYQLQFSTDNLTWTTKRTILTSKLTDNAYNFIRMNPITARYFRLRGSSGASVVCAIEIIKSKNGVTDTDFLNAHYHQDISSTDTSLTLAGD